MNEQQPTQDNALPTTTPTDFSPAGAYPNYAPAGYPEELAPGSDFVAGLPTPEPGFLAQEASEVAHLEMPPLAQPLQSSALLSGLGALASRDGWDQTGNQVIETLSHISTEAPLSALPLSALPLSALPLSALPLSALPLSALPLSALPLSALPLSALPLPSFSTPEPIDLTQRLAPLSPPTIPNVSFSAPLPAAQQHIDNPETEATQVPAFGAAAFEAPSFPAAPALTAAPSFPSTPAFPAAPFTSPPSIMEPFDSPNVQPFDAGDSFGPLDLIRPQVSEAPKDPYEGGVDFSSNPLPRPEALVMRPQEEPEKPGRFGRKKKAQVDLLSVGQESQLTASVSALSSGSPTSPLDKKTKRFGKKPTQTVDLLGAPIAARALETSDPTQSSVAPSLAIEDATEGKAKRKLFARVDRSKEKPLAPTNRRARKMIQGLAALSLLAGAGLFTLSFLDKKSPSPAPESPTVETTVSPAADPTVSTIAPVQIDPATGVATPEPGDPLSAPTNPDASASPTSAVEGSSSVDTAPAPVDPVTTITPGPDDLEFSTGGNFSEG